MGKTKHLKVDTINIINPVFMTLFFQRDRENSLRMRFSKPSTRTSIKSTDKYL